MTEWAALDFWVSNSTSVLTPCLQYAVVGGVGSAAILSTMAALVKYYLGSTDKPGINALVALCFIFGAFFTSTVECTSYVYGSEIWPTHLRSEGATLAYASFFGNAIAYSAPVSVALKTIGWKFYMILVSVTLASTIVIFFYFPDVSSSFLLSRTFSLTRL